MKIFSISLIQVDVQPAKVVSAVYELASFSYFQRGRCVLQCVQFRSNCREWIELMQQSPTLPNSIQEFMTFFSKTLAERTKQPGQRQSVENQGTSR